MIARFTLVLCIALAGCGARGLDIGSSSDPDAGSGGATPEPGTHSTVLVPRLRDGYGLATEGNYLYWVRGAEFGGEITRCEKRDCSGTRQTVAQAKEGGGLLVRKGTMYFGMQGSIVSCPVDDCSQPTVIVRQGGGLGVVDDTHVFWASLTDTAILSCPLTGCEKATVAPATAVGRVMTLVADETHLYWTSLSNEVSGPSGFSERFSVFSAPKDGSAPPKPVATDIVKATSLVADGGFAYWATLEAKGVIARCPTSGCPDGKPEILVGQQYYPHHLTFADGKLFWMNEVDDPAFKLTEFNRPARIVGCNATRCSETVELLDQSRGGSLIDPTHSVWYRPQQLVADSEAVYWFGDFTPLFDTDGQIGDWDVSIRRAPSTPSQ